MNRRTNLAVMISGALAAAAVNGAGNSPIQLHVDLQVAPEREKELADNYKNTFRPAIRKQPHFVDVKLLKFRSAPAGTNTSNANYRLVLSFDTEEARQQWVKTDLHQRVWPTIEKTLKSAQFNALLYDPIG